MLFYLCGADLESKDGVGTQDLLDLLRTKIPEGVKIYTVTGEIAIWEVVNDGTQNRMVETKSFSGKYMTDPKFLSQIIDYVAPASASALTVARPIPELAPVTIAVFPLSLVIVLLNLL